MAGRAADAGRGPAGGAAETAETAIFAALQCAGRIRAAGSRGVAVSVVVQTLQGAGNALSGDEPYRAFAGIPGIELWHTPTSQRGGPAPVRAAEHVDARRSSGTLTRLC